MRARSHPSRKAWTGRLVVTRRFLPVLLLFGILLPFIGCRHQAVRVPQPGAPPSPGRTGSTRSSNQPGYPAVDADSAGTPPPGTLLAIPAGARLLSTEIGIASWYGTVYDHRRAADGGIYDQEGMTAASRTLPLGVLVRVTNMADGEIAVARITDRGPFIPGRIIDLSSAAAKTAGLYRAGVGMVRVEAFAPLGFVEPPARWCVQIGAFADPQDAMQMKNDLLRRYPGAKVIWFQGPTGSWARLTLPVPDRAASNDVAATVHVPDPGVEAYVTRTN